MSAATSPGTGLAYGLHAVAANVGIPKPSTERSTTPDLETSVEGNSIGV